MAFSIELWKHPIQQDGYGLSNWLLAEKRQVWAHTKEAAIFHAVHVIDKVLGMEPKTTTPKMVCALNVA
jgi:hypothetical protein